MIGQWKAFLLEKTAEWDLPKRGDWTFLLNNNYHPHCSNLNLLWFHNGGEFPRVVTKLFREPQLPQREFENLKQAYPSAAAWVPKPLHFGRQGEFCALWMEGVPGLRFRASNGPVQLRSLIEMLASMHRAFRTTEMKPERYRRVVSKPIETVAQFGESAAVRSGCEILMARTSADWVQSLPVIPQHGDLVFSNVLLFRGQWHVVDWESFGVIDLPFYDLFTLLLSLLRAHGETPEHWDASLMKQVPALIGQYALALELSSTDAPLLLALTLANWFHLQWSDGRREFTNLMYKMIQHYFEHREAWESIFFPNTVLQTST